MVKTFSKKRKFKRIGGRQRHSRHSTKKRLQWRKSKLDLKTKKNENVNNQLNQMNISPAVITPNDTLSKFSQNRIDFLVTERDNTLNEYFLRENVEFIPFIPLAISDPSIIKNRHLALFGLFDIIKQLINSTGFKFPLDLEQKVIALYDLFLTNVNPQNQMKMSYLTKTLFACVSLYDKEEGLNVFINDFFQFFPFWASLFHCKIKNNCAYQGNFRKKILFPFPTMLSNGQKYTLLPFPVFHPDDFKRIAHQFARQRVLRLAYAQPNPIALVGVVWVGDAIVAFLELHNALGLAFQRNHLEIINVKITKHVSTGVKDQHGLRRIEFHERRFLFDVVAQRKAEVAQRLDVHGLQIF